MKMPVLFKTMIKHISIIACCLLLFVSSTSVNLRNVVAQDEELTQTLEQDVQGSVNEEVEENNNLSNEEENEELVSNENNQSTEEVETVSNEMSQTTQEKEEVVSNEESQTSEEVETLSNEENKTIEETNVEENVETVVEVNYPSFNESKVIDNITITVSATEGVFPEGSYLYIEKVDNDTLKQVDDVINEQRNKDANVVSSYTFDIKVFDKDNNEVQPADNNSVKVSFKLQEVENNNLDAQVYHVSDTNLSVEQLNVENDNDTLIVETESFSYYTVEFTYNNLQYVLQGDESIELNTVLETLGLSGEVSSVTVSDKTLFDVVNENGKWIVHSYKAFTSTEWMKVTINDVEYEIVVTDAIPGNTVTGMVDMDAGQTKAGNFTITGGPVRGPLSGTATISSSTVTNKAKNDKKGGVSNTDGSTFISRGANSLVFNAVHIFSSDKPLVFNIWANSSITAKKTNLYGESGTWSKDDPFLLIGGYPGGEAGTLNFTGDKGDSSFIFDTTGAIAGGNNNSVINVNGGYLHIVNSDITLQDGVQIVVKSGATLSIINNSTITGSSRTAIVVEEGGTLIVHYGSTITGTNTLIDNSGKTTIHQSKINGGSGATAIINRESGTLDIDWGSELTSATNQAVIENRGTTTIKGESTINANRTNDWSINNYNVLSMTDSTLNIADGALGIITRQGGASTELNTVEVSFAGAGRGLLVQGESDLTITGDSNLHGLNAENNYNFVAMIDPDGILNIEGNTIISDNKSISIAPQAGTVVVSGGTLNVGQNDRDNVKFKDNIGAGYWGPANGWRFGGGAINIYNDATANIANAEFSNNKADVVVDNDDNSWQGSGGAIAAYKSNVNIGENTSFKNNIAAAFGGAIALASCDFNIIGGEDENSWIVFDGNKIDPGIDTGEWEGKNSYMGAGGAIYIDAEYDDFSPDASNGKLDGLKVINNIAIDCGGGIAIGYWHGYEDQFTDYSEYVPNQVKVTMNNMLVDNNTATHGSTDRGGGGIYISDNARVLTDSMIIHDNHADGVAGGLYSCFVGTSFVLPEGQIAIFDNDSDTLADSNDAMLAYTSRDTIPEMMLGSTKDVPTVHNWKMKPIENMTRGDTPFQTGLAMTSNPQTLPPNTDNPEAAKNIAKQASASIVVTNNKATSEFNPGGYGYVVENVYDPDSEVRNGFGIAGGNGGGVTCNGVLEIGSGDYAGFIIKKVDADTDIALKSPVGFKLVGANEDGSNKNYTSTVYTDNNGIANYNIVPYGTYYLNEIATPEGYKTSIKAYKVVANESGVTIYDNQGKEVDKGSQNVVNALGNEVDENILKNTQGADKKIELYVLKNWHVDQSTLPENLTITGRLYWGPSETEQYFTGVSFWIDASTGWKVDLGEWPVEWSDGVNVVYTVKELDDDANEVENEQIASILGTEYETLYDGTHRDYNPEEEEDLIIHNGHRGIIRVEKKWDDNNNNDGMQPKEITVILRKNYEEIEEVVLNKENDWKYDFGLHYFYENGSKVVYDVIEKETAAAYSYIVEEIASKEEVKVGSQTIERDVKTYIITNTHKDETINIGFSKKWNDSNNKDRMRPASITVNLLADGELIDTVKVEEKDNWSYTFKDLPKYKNGKEIKYSLTEENVYGYTYEVIKVEPKTNETAQELDNDKIEELDQPISQTIEYIIINTHIPKEPDKPKYQVPKTGIE